MHRRPDDAEHVNPTCRRTSSAPTSASRRTATTRRRPTPSSATSRSTAASTSSDRAEFYVPWVQNRGNANQMFLGTYRLYRTDNAEAPVAGDVTWTPISGDLTSGCTGAAPNGARGCLISRDRRRRTAATASTPAPTTARPGQPGRGQLGDTPTWTAGRHRHALPEPAGQPDRGRPLATGGSPTPPTAASTPPRRQRPATCSRPPTAASTGRTSAATCRTSRSTRSSSTRPTRTRSTSAPTSAPFVTNNGGAHWSRLGTGMPKVAVWQLDYDARHRLLAAGTHGRGAYTLERHDDALRRSSSPRPTPASRSGRGSRSTTRSRCGTSATPPATGVTITDPLPDNTTLRRPRATVARSTSRGRSRGRA